MSLLDRVLARLPADVPLSPIDPVEWASQRPTYRDARPDLIDAAAKRAAARPSGNWFVLAASTDIRSDRPYGGTIGRHELVAWRGPSGRLIAGPGACPHLGAPLAEGRVDCGTLRCRWHGLPLDETGGPGWSPLPTHDDGVLAWVRLDDLGGEPPLPAPVLGRRPALASSVAAVATVTGTCEPDDVIANRLDPWHGAWFHPYSFTRLTVLSAPDPEADLPDEHDRFVVDVTFRLGRRVGVPVRAEFTSPEPRTLAMRIIDGEGRDSVVETHATPRAPGADGRPRTSVIEATIATSDRRGFGTAARFAPALRPLMRRAATRLWRDDLAYAERRYALRSAP
ncbi:Rieske (2Fe-2S) protein [Actinophytocola gossypii]|uniref:Rieske (2Fe-2S) protein n=1 Tax=Actinophytocola gossypii TaxID=2812003 RepID=A0ABT2JKC9_9PSEU|nr:Rieske (2Fe-2S) protein [Actinophytocola gossypii]MCT2587754.1 Rieske (2Fe-2S) protein [Actinophytocola gossypii]